MKKYNFSAGPCALPQSVIEKASKSVINLNNSGLSIAEISHRSNEFVEIIENARSLVKELLELPEGYSVLFLQGGASLGFLMVPYNLLKKGGKAAYIDTGAWSLKAIKEAKLLGEIDVIASSKENNYKHIPTNYNIPEDADYLHITSNNTIYGTQYKKIPNTKIPLICDMSSDIFSRKLDFKKFGIIYAGAQKNIGPAGATLVVVKDDILGKTGRKIPSMLNYQTHIEKESMFNTPSVFSIYVSMLNLEWLKNKGGISEIEKINEEKAKILYDEIDRNPLIEGYSNKENRSLMNVTFNLTENTNKNLFDQLWKNANICNLNGHRSIGGYRASIYNAMPIEGVKLLVEVMQEFERKS